MMSRFKTMMKDQKQRVAFLSVIATVFLIIIKSYVGIVTNSLGILSEALHSSLDFVAAFITMLTVVSASKPADSEHQFGHGKAENLSALAQTMLLLITCAWIFWEASDRIVHSHTNVDASIAAFATMMISVAVNLVMARALYGAAREYNSQAVEASALHFSSDILSSAVVIAGLASVRLGFPLGDPIASIGVALIIVYASFQLGKRTLDALMDRAPAGKTDEIRKAVESIEGVKIERIRVRSSGPHAFVDLNISLDRTLGLESSRDIVTEVEAKVREILLNADVVVQVEPRMIADEDLSSKIKLIALKKKAIRNVHNIEVNRIGNDIIVEVHLEVDADTTVRDAHELVSGFERETRAQLGVRQVYTHIETYTVEPESGQDLTEKEARIVEKVKEVASRYAEITDCHRISVMETEGKTSVNLHCRLQADETLEKAHHITTELELAIREELKDLDHITIHVEPAEQSPTQSA